MKTKQALPPPAKIIGFAACPLPITGFFLPRSPSPIPPNSLTAYAPLNSSTL